MKTRYKRAYASGSPCASTPTPTPPSAGGLRSLVDEAAEELRQHLVLALAAVGPSPWRRRGLLRSHVRGPGRAGRVPFGAQTGVSVLGKFISAGYRRLQRADGALINRNGSTN